MSNFSVSFKQSDNQKIVNIIVQLRFLFFSRVLSDPCKSALSGRKLQQLHSNLQFANPENIQRSLEAKPDPKRPGLRLQTAQSAGQGLHDNVANSVRGEAGKRQGIPAHREDLEREPSAESMQLESGMVRNFPSTAHRSQALLWWKLQVPNFTVLHSQMSRAQRLRQVFGNPHKQLRVASLLLPCKCWRKSMLLARDRWIQELHKWSGDALKTIHDFFYFHENDCNFVYAIKTIHNFFISKKMIVILLRE